MLLHSKRNPINIFFYLFIASLSLAKVSYTQYCVQETAAYLQSYRELRRQRTQRTHSPNALQSNCKSQRNTAQLSAAGAPKMHCELSDKSNDA